MKKRLLSWLLVLCMAITLLPGQALATEGSNPQSSEMGGSALADDPVCTCGAVPGEDGVTIHQPECPLYVEPEATVPVEDPACTCGAVPGEDGVTVHQPECPLYTEVEISTPVEESCP